MASEVNYNPNITTVDFDDSGGSTQLSIVSFTRPANTTAYSISDIITDNSSGVLAFPNVAQNQAGTGYVVKVILETDNASMVAKTRLHMYTLAPTGIADNAALPLKWADAINYIGYVDLGTMSAEAGGAGAMSISQAVDVRVAFVLPAKSAVIYGQLEAIEAFTPTSGQQFKVRFVTEATN